MYSNKHKNTQGISSALKREGYLMHLWVENREKFEYTDNIGSFHTSQKEKCDPAIQRSRETKLQDSTHKQQAYFN